MSLPDGREDDTYKLDRMTVGKGVPSTWSLSEAQDETTYRTQLRAGVKLFEELYAATLAVDGLNNLGKAIPLPQGIRVEHDKGQPRAHIDLPERLDSLSSDSRVANYQRWLGDNLSQIKKAADEIASFKKNPYLRIEFADIALSPSTIMGDKIHKKAILDADGKQVEIVDPSSRVNRAERQDSGQDTSSLREYDVDVLKKRFDARRVDSADQESDVIVDVTAQAQRGRFGYDLFNEDVGAPIHEQHRYKADELVFYGGRFVPAKSLPSAAARDNFVIAAGKALDIVLDGAMVSLGLSKLAKLNILRSCSPLIKESVPAAASGLTSEITGRSLGAAAAYALTETSMGAMGFFANNKWGESNLSWVNGVRGVYFTGLCIGGLSRRISSTISGGEFLNAKLAEAGPAWLRRADQVAETSMLASLPLQVGSVAYSTYEHTKRILAHHQNSKAPLPENLVLLAARALPSGDSVK